MMFIHEFNKTHNEKYVESRTYLDGKSGIVTFYQYTFKNNKVVSTNCIELPIKQLGAIAKSVLKSYILLMK